MTPTEDRAARAKLVDALGVWGTLAHARKSARALSAKLETLCDDSKSFVRTAVDPDGKGELCAKLAGDIAQLQLSLDLLTTLLGNFCSRPQIRDQILKREIRKIEEAQYKRAAASQRVRP